MRNLLNFLIKYNYWFLFLLLEVTSFVLLFRFNHYQQSVYFTSANGVAGKVYEISGGISSYFHLKSVNEDLLDRNMWLEQRVAFLEKSLQEQGLDSVKLYSMARLAPDDYRIFKANVIKNSLNKADNYITLDRGSSDGIRPEMGVVDANGVVGIVYKTSPRYSLVIPLLNSKSSISCKIVGSEYFGYLKWEGGDSRFAYLKDLPRHAEFNLGDTVVTSGYSTVFPEGVMVGTVDDMSDSHDGLSYLLKIKLATDFGKVSNVRVISRSGQEEQNMLELLQVLILNNVHIAGYATPFLYIYMILKFESDVPRNALMLWAFFLGLAVDILSDTPGMNAAATVLLAFLRPTFLRLFVPRDTLDTLVPAVRTMGISPFLKYLVASVLVHHGMLLTLEFFSFVHIGALLLRIVTSTLLTVACIMAVEGIRKK